MLSKVMLQCSTYRPCFRLKQFLIRISFIKPTNHAVLVSLIFEFVELLLSLKTYLGGGQAQSTQTMGSLLIPLASKAGRGNDWSIAAMDLTNSNITHKIGLFLQAKAIEKNMKHLQKLSTLKNWRKVVCESALRQRN
jgi:hypothetical protein